MQERFRSPRIHTRFPGQVVEAQVVLISYYTDHRAPPGKRKGHAGCLCLDGWLFTKLQCDLEEKNKFMRCDGAWQASNQGLWDLMSVTKNVSAEQVDQNLAKNGATTPNLPTT